MLIFRKKFSPIVFFFFWLNYNFNHLLIKNNDYLIRLGVFLTFFEVITNFLNPLNIWK